jgi:hypothetical protein
LEESCETEAGLGAALKKNQSRFPALNSSRSPPSLPAFSFKSHPGTMFVKMFVISVHTCRSLPNCA